MDEEDLQNAVEEIKTTESVVLINLKNTEPASLNYITLVSSLLEEVLKKLGPFTKKSKTDYYEWLMECYKQGVDTLENQAIHNSRKENRGAAFKALLHLIPLYNDAFHTKPHFPIEEYSAIIRLLMSSESDIGSLLSILKEYMMYEDMNLTIWKAIDKAVEMDRPLVVKELRHVIQIIGIIEPLQEVEAPKLYYSRVKVGILSAKETDKCVKRIWNRLALVKVDNDVKQLLMLTLLEKMMCRMDKPIFLTDYFMESLDQGGAVGVLSLQGIFDLIQKYNMDYPNVYGKLYSMFTPELFGTTYKSRFYFLSDLFMSSTMLPEALVAGFSKRLARLALVAPPPDAIILMAFITNLIIRHPHLKVLLSRPGVADFDCDPYLPDEPNPSDSRAIDSCLWEIKLLQDHVLPTVANAASFINHDMPTVEKDLSFLFESKTEAIFEKERNIRVPEPPLSFERPSATYLNKPAVRLAFSAWE